MNLNGNLVKKNKKEDVDVDIDMDTEGLLEEENDLDQEIEKGFSFSSNNFAKNRMFKFMGIIIGIAIVLILIMFIFSVLSPKTYTYSDIESILEKAAISYFNDYPESLPKNEGSIVEIDSSNLTEAGKMKAISEYTKEGVTCTGTVQVEKSSSEYFYTPFLNCGGSYTTSELYKKIISDTNIVTSGYGLYNKNGTYTYRGEDVNNFVELDRGLWRIVKITPNNNIVLISNQGTAYTHPWDNRYNENESYDAGKNQYSISRVKELLNKIYTNPSTKDTDDEYLISKSDRAKTVSFDLCIGKRSATSEAKDNSLECTEKLQNQKIGLLTLSDYMYASLDPNCKNSTTKSCKNYNYLAKQKDWWLVTADSTDGSKVFQIDSNAKIISSVAGNYSGVRPIIYLNSKVLYKSGNGSFEKPYKVK